MASGTMTCDKCKSSHKRVLFQAKVAKQNPGPMGGTRMTDEEWCAACIAQEIPAGMFQEPVYD